MTRYALLLRGVNVGAKNKLPMVELRRMLEEAGCTDVVTYIQSGNAALTTSSSAEQLLHDVELALEAYMGRPIATTVRTGRELEQIIEHNPFRAIAAEPKNLCVTFLSSAPDVSALAPLDERDWSPECFKVVGRDIYTWYPGGQGRSTLAVALGKVRFDGTSTTRNWNTVLKLRDLLVAEG